MSVALYMNHCVNVAITDGLRPRGVDVITAHEDGAATLEDDEITIGQAIRDLELIAKAMDPADMRNGIEFIPY